MPSTCISINDIWHTYIMHSSRDAGTPASRDNAEKVTPPSKARRMRGLVMSRHAYMHSGTFHGQAAAALAKTSGPATAVAAAETPEELAAGRAR